MAAWASERKVDGFMPCVSAWASWILSYPLAKKMMVATISSPRYQSLMSMFAGGGAAFALRLPLQRLHAPEAGTKQLHEEHLLAGIRAFRVWGALCIGWGEKIV
jgi:hypothetical protein